MKSDKHTGKPKLTLDQVILAVTELKHVSGRKLAKMWGVSHATVNNVRKGQSWRSHMILLGLPINDKAKNPEVEEKTLQNI